MRPRVGPHGKRIPGTAPALGDGPSAQGFLGRLAAEVTGPEAQRIIVDPDEEVLGRILAPSAESLAVDVTLGALQRPAETLGEHPRLFPERDNRHDSTPLVRMLGWNGRVTEVGI